MVTENTKLTGDQYYGFDMWTRRVYIIDPSVKVNTKAFKSNVTVTVISFIIIMLTILEAFK